jgi:hypothetical protein
MPHCVRDMRPFNPEYPDAAPDNFSRRYQRRVEAANWGGPQEICIWARCPLFAESGIDWRDHNVRKVPRPDMTAQYWSTQGSLKR